MTTPDFDIVVPTIGRPSLAALLEALAQADGPPPGRIVVVDDRRDRSTALLPGGVPEALTARLSVLPGRARGPAAARNLGWRATHAPWIAFLDDDVVPASDWLVRLAEDLTQSPSGVAASQGQIHVPRPVGRRPTDWERNVQRLEHALWATADMAFRRSVLDAVGGFDERFSRAYREDTDLALRIRAAGWRIERGRRRVTHPVRPASRWISVRAQAGNADDVLMRALHGPDWRTRAGDGPGRLPRHLATTAAGLVALAALMAKARSIALVGAALWTAGTAEFAWARIAPGPRTADEIATMVVTSATVPAAATFHWLRGWVTLPAKRTAGRSTGLAGSVHADRGRRYRHPRPTRPRAVLFDRDGTLVIDVPYNGDPDRVVPVPGAREALDRLRAAGVQLAVVSNQSGVARGLITLEDVDAVNRRIETLLGPLGPWFVCPHGVEERCGCRKPAPGLVLRAATALGVRPEDCAFIGDTGADVGAARAAGARAILVPTSVTRVAEVETAPEVVTDLTAAIDLLLGGSPAPGDST